ncbi:MAG: HEPN domain-containing protein [bacterium]
MNEKKADLIKYRISKAYSTLNEVEEHLRNKFYATAINRLYYSCFYAVNAILSFIGFSSKTHKGTMILFHQQLVLKDIINQEHSKLYNTLFKARQENDYDDFIEPDPEVLPDWFKQAKEFIDSINTYISKEIG